MCFTRTAFHLHDDDAPKALAILRALFIGSCPAERQRAGYEPTQHGAYVDWDTLTTSYLSTTETAVAHIAHGIAMLERHGGSLPARLAVPVAGAAASIR